MVAFVPGWFSAKPVAPPVITPQKTTPKPSENLSRSCNGVVRATFPEPTSSMVAGLLRHISTSGDHVSCENELEALIDIATFKNPAATDASRSAERGLLGIYADRRTSSAQRQNIVRQLMEAEQIIASPNAYTMQFAMPASLLHLVAQHVQRAMAEQEPDVVTDLVRLEDMKRAVADATGLTDEPNIACHARFVTSDEVLASMASVPGVVDAVVNLSDYVAVEDKQWNLQLLLDKVPDTSVAFAPLLINNHFMLIAAEKCKTGDDFNLMVVNTLLPIDEELSHVPECMRQDPAYMQLQTDKKADAFSAKLLEKIKPAYAGRVRGLNVRSHNLQSYTANSCGPLVSLIAEVIAKTSKKHRGDNIKTGVAVWVDEWANKWRGLNQQQRQNYVISRRAKMMGDMVEWKSETRFVDSATLRPRENAKTEDSRL